MNEWPKAPTYWLEEDTGFVSVPFTWTIPEVVTHLKSSLFANRWFVGGPAAYLQPEAFSEIDNVTILEHLPGVLQRVNPRATKTSEGCVRKCKFCAVPRTEGAIKELDDWPDLPVICDNNLLACSVRHIDAVFDLAEHHKRIDFNGGLDIRLMTPHIMERLARLRQPIIRVALDSDGLRACWSATIDAMRAHGICKSYIRSFVLVGFEGTPEADWERCEFVESKGVRPLPQWFHPLDATEWNGVTKEQRELGWTEHKQKRLMGYFYQRRDIGEEKETTT